MILKQTAIKRYGASVMLPATIRMVIRLAGTAGRYALWRWCGMDGIALTGSFLLLDLLLLSPVQWSNAAYCWSLLHGGSKRYGRFFLSAFSGRFMAAVRFRLGLWIRIFLYAAVAFFPSAVFLSLAGLLGNYFSAGDYAPLLAAVFRWISLMMSVCGGVFLLTVWISYCPAVYLCLSGLPADRALGLSRQWMKGNINAALCRLFPAAVKLLPALLLLPIPFSLPQWELAKAEYVMSRFKE